MGEAKDRAAAEAAERAAWADEIVADVVALEHAALRAVMGGNVGEFPSPEQAERASALATLAVLRSVGADLASVADAIDAATSDDDPDDEDDGLISVPTPRKPFSLIDKPAAPGILPE